jgi:hypothetical protein
MKAINIISLLIAMSSSALISCDKFGAATPAPCEFSLYPGECFNGYRYTGFEVDSTGVDTGFWIRFRLEFDKLSYEVLSKSATGRITAYRYCPTDAVFNTFGDDSEKVKESYYSIVNSNPSVTYPLYMVTTIYADGGLSLKANKQFAGIAAGEELAELAIIPEYPSPFPVNPPEGMNSLWRNFEIMIPLNDREIVSEDVVMHLEIPVKVGLLLHTLHDRLSDPDSPMQYENRILICDFTIPKNLN